MARGSSQSEAGDRLRLKADYKTAEAARLRDAAAKADRIDEEKKAKAAAKAKDKAEKELKAAVKDPAKMAERIKVVVDKDGNVSFNLDGEDLERYGFSGRTSKFGKGWFEGVFKELPPSVKDDFSTQLKDKGMSTENARKAADLIAVKAAEAMFGKMDIKKILQDPANQAEITKAFEDLSAKVSRNSEARATAREYSSSPSDDGSYNMYAADAGRALTNHIAYVNRLRDEIGSIDIGIQYGEKVVNKQTEDWIEDLVYGGALERAYKKHRDLFID
jgi:hypothetical protein